MTRYDQPKLMEAARAMPTWTVDPDGTHGEVFTRRWVVELILDLAGYRASEDLGASVIVEPACGTGAFLMPITERLAESCTSHGRPLADMGPAIRAFDVLDRNVEAARQSVTARNLAEASAAQLHQHGDPFRIVTTGQHHRSWLSMSSSGTRVTGWLR